MLLHAIHHTMICTLKNRKFRGHSLSLWIDFAAKKTSKTRGHANLLKFWNKRTFPLHTSIPCLVLSNRILGDHFLSLETTSCIHQTRIHSCSHSKKKHFILCISKTVKKKTHKELSLALLNTTSIHHFEPVFSNTLQLEAPFPLLF